MNDKCNYKKPVIVCLIEKAMSDPEWDNTSKEIRDTLLLAYKLLT
jgi:hypothetical protein